MASEQPVALVPQPPGPRPTWIRYHGTMAGPKQRVTSMAGPYQRIAEGQSFSAAKKVVVEPEPPRAKDPWRYLPFVLIALLVALRLLSAPNPIPPLPAAEEAPSVAGPAEGGARGASGSSLH